MSDDQQHAQLGRYMSQHKAANDLTGKLRVEAAEIGSKLVEIGNTLHMSPELIELDGEGIEARYASRARFIKRSTFDIDKILELVRSYRAAIRESERTADALAKLGHRPT